MLKIKKSKESNRVSHQEVSILFSPQWIMLFMLIAIPASFFPFIIGFVMGYTVASDFIFGIYGLISGIFSEFVIRTKFKKKLMLFKKPRVTFMMLWIVLCLYVMLFRPFQ